MGKKQKLQNQNSQQNNQAHKPASDNNDSKNKQIKKSVNHNNISNNKQSGSLNSNQKGN